MTRFGADIGRSCWVSIAAQGRGGLPCHSPARIGRGPCCCVRRAGVYCGTQVVAFLEVDAKKIAHGAYHDHASGRRIAIVHFAQASRAAAPTGKPGAALHPIITCVKSGLHSGFEENLASLGLHEGTDYVFFN